MKNGSTWCRDHARASKANAKSNVRPLHLDFDMALGRPGNSGHLLGIRWSVWWQLKQSVGIRWSNGGEFHWFHHCLDRSCFASARIGYLSQYSDFSWFFRAVLGNSIKTIEGNELSPEFVDALTIYNTPMWCTDEAATSWNRYGAKCFKICQTYRATKPSVDRRATSHSNNTMATVFGDPTRCFLHKSPNTQGQLTKHSSPKLAKHPRLK